MKKSILISTLVVFILAGCTKQNKGSEQNQQASTPKESEAKVEVVSEVTQEVKTEVKTETKQMIPGVMLWDEATFWTEKDDGKMYWKLTVDYGTAFECYPSASGSSSLVETKKAIRVITSTKEEAEKEFTKISYQNTDYWVQTSIIAINAVPAMVIKENTFVYKTPDIEKITTDKLPVGTIIALSKEVPIDGFIKVSARIGEKLYDEVYIKLDKVSENTADIKALSMIEKINKSKDKAIQLELLDNTKSLNVSPEIKDMLSDLENTLVNGNSKVNEETKKIEEISSDISKKVSSVADDVSKKTEDLSEKVKEESSEIKNKIEEKAEAVEEKAKEIKKVITNEPKIIIDNGK